MKTHPYLYGVFMQGLLSSQLVQFPLMATLRLQSEYRKDAIYHVKYIENINSWGRSIYRRIHLHLVSYKS